MRLTVFLLAGLLIRASGADAPTNGLAPEVPGLNLADNLYQLEAKLPDLTQPFVSDSPQDKGDGLTVGKLGEDGGDKAMVETFAKEISANARDEKTGNADSLLISYRGKLVFESYFRRGRANFPHYQMSITKSLTALSVGRAIQLGLLRMEDLDAPAISLISGLDRSRVAPGAESVTLSQAMQMTSGIRISEEKTKELLRQPARLKGRGEIQAYLEHSAPIPKMPREFKYQEPDTAIAMQVLDSATPKGAEAFIKDELLGRMDITRYHWEKAISGLPKSAAGSSLLSRDMVKFGQLILNKGRWKGEQLIPEAYLVRATTPSQANPHYGFFWWVDDFVVSGKTFHCVEGRGAGGQFIFMLPELDLVVVVTSHDKGMGDMLRTVPLRLIPAFAPLPVQPGPEPTKNTPKKDELTSLFEATLDYYGKLQRTPNGMYRDAYKTGSGGAAGNRCSAASVGVGLMALCMEHELGRDKEAGKKALQTLRGINGKQPPFAIGRNSKGWFKHFFSSEGTPSNSEYSTIDTAIMTVGALYCRNTFDDVAIRAEADELWKSVDWESALADADGRRLHMAMTAEGLPVEKSTTHLFNEYLILSWLIKEAQIARTGRSDIVSFDRLNTWDNRGLRLLCANGPWPQCSFLVQFPLYMCGPCVTDPRYREFAAAQAAADQRECAERTGMAHLWGCGAGMTPEGAYRASHYRRNPDNMVSPSIVAGFMTVMPAAKEHLLKLYHTPGRRLTTPVGDLLPRFSADKPDWTTPRVEAIDYSSMLFGLAASDPRLGMDFFAKATKFTFGKPH